MGGNGEPPLRGESVGGSGMLGLIRSRSLTASHFPVTGRPTEVSGVRRGKPATPAIGERRGSRETLADDAPRRGFRPRRSVAHPRARGRGPQQALGERRGGVTALARGPSRRLRL